MINDLIQKYVMESSQTKLKMTSKLFELFTETTGYRPEDICLVERQIKKGDMEYETIFYFDTKSKYQYTEPTEASRTPIKWPSLEQIKDVAKHEDSDGYFGFLTGCEWLKSFVEKGE